MYIIEQHTFLNIFSERAKNSVNSWHLLAYKDISHISDVRESVERHRFGVRAKK